MMDKILLLILFTLLSFADQKFYDRDDTVIKEGIFYLKSNNKPFTGVMKFGGNWGHYERPYKNGKRDGIRKEYYETGRLKTEMPYKNGKTYGVTKSYHENGNLRAEVPYKNETLHGQLKG